MKESLTGLAVLLGYAVFFIVIIYCATNPNTYWSKQYTVYQMSCKDFKSSQFSCNEGFYLNKISFIPLLERQSVVADYGVFISRTDNCEVFDAKNWICNEGGKNNQSLIMKDGNFRDMGDKAQDKEYFPVTAQISRLEYNIREWVDFFIRMAGIEKQTKPIIPGEASGQDDPSKIVAACLNIAAQTYAVPPAVLVGLYKHENGKVGDEVKQDDGSYLLGVMKISSAEISELSKMWRVDSETGYRWVKDDACTNIGVAAWRFRSYLDQTGSLSEAIVKYGEHRKQSGSAFKENILQIMRDNNLLTEGQ